MIPVLRLRVLTHADLPFADSLRDLARWNQTLADWERFLTLAPDGCFLAEWVAVPAGTATTIVYGTELAWIGMVLVHPDYRRRGIGRALLEKCIEHLRQRSVRCLKLDATPQGKSVYDSLGFKDEWTMTRWERAPGETRRALADPEIRNRTEADASAIDRLDSAAFGISRALLLRLLTAESHSAVVLESKARAIEGYGLIRRGSQALYLGPIVAESPDAGIRVADALVERATGERLFWDIPDSNTAAIECARRCGFTVQRKLTRMFLGQNTVPGNAALRFGIAGPALG